MNLFKRLSFLGGLVFVASLLLAVSGLLTSSAFAATTTPHGAAPAITRNAVIPAAAINACPPSVQQGSSGTWVQALQFRLNALHSEGLLPNTRYNPPLSTDGGFGPQTDGAVRDFQSNFGLGIDGQVGPQTWTALGFCTTGNTVVLDTSFANSTHCPSTLQQGNSGTLVMALQSRLNFDFNFGYFGNTPNNFSPFLSADGGFGPLTNAAVKDFQTQTGAGVDGVVGQQTWSLLGMCY